MNVQKELIGERKKSSYKGIDLVVLACKMSSSLGSFKANFEQAKEDLSYYDRVTQDVLHAIELLDDQYEVDFSELTKELKEARQKRREAKDFIELAMPIYKVIEEHPELINKLRQAHSQVSRIQKKHATRTYTPREMVYMNPFFQDVKSV